MFQLKQRSKIKDSNANSNDINSLLNFIFVAAPIIMTKQFKIYLSVLLAMIFWSFSFIWFKEANQTLRPMTIVFSRLIIATLAIIIYLYVAKKFVKIEKKDYKLFFWLSFCEPFLYFLGESHGLTMVSATVGSVIIATIPVVIAIAAWIFLKEKLGVINYVGIALSFIGVLVFVMNNNGELVYDLKGLILMFMTVLSAVAYGIFLGKLVNSYSPFFIVFVQNLIGTVLFLPVFLISDMGYVSHNLPALADFLPVVKLGIFASVGAFALFAVAVKDMGVARANVFTNFIPVLTAIFSFFILDEQLSVRSISGMVIVVCGLLLAQLRSKKQDIKN